jgi:hypothetical protein
MRSQSLGSIATNYTIANMVELFFFHVKEPCWTETVSFVRKSASVSAMSGEGTRIADAYNKNFTSIERYRCTRYLFEFVLLQRTVRPGSRIVNRQPKHYQVQVRSTGK